MIIIGEAARHLSSELRNRHPQVPWQDIIGVRDKLIHDYFGVDVWMVWLVARDDLPLLKTQIIEILDQVSRMSD